MLIRETHVNKTLHCCITDDYEYTAHASTLGNLFRDMQREYGRCASKMYRDVPGSTASYQVGWVFEKHRKYSDCAETYLHEVWVEVMDNPDAGPYVRHPFPKPHVAYKKTFVLSVWSAYPGTIHRDRHTQTHYLDGDVDYTPQQSTVLTSKQAMRLADGIVKLNRRTPVDFVPTINTSLPGWCATWSQPCH